MGAPEVLVKVLVEGRVVRGGMDGVLTFLVGRISVQRGGFGLFMPIYE